jgi:hypothetical protein
MPSGKLRRIVLRLARQHCSWPVPVRHSFGQLLVRQELKQFVSGLNRPATKHATTLHRLLEVRGICSYVIDPASVQVDRRARRGETDGVDVERLFRSLVAEGLERCAGADCRRRGRTVGSIVSVAG